MHRIKTPLALLLTLAALAILVPATTSAIPPIGQKDNGFSKTDERYLHTYVQCWHAFQAKCGRNIVDDGLSSGKAPSDARVAESNATMQRWLNPPAPSPAASVSEGDAGSTPVATSVPTAPVSTGGCPSYMAAEAGSPDAVNPSSGAAGCYQVLPSTAAAMGGACADVNADSCVAAICASQGNAAWASSGATPCDYLGRP